VKLPSGHTSVIILNKDAAADLGVELDFGRDLSGVVQTETFHAPGLDSRDAHITTSNKTDSLKQGKCSVTSPMHGLTSDTELESLTGSASSAGRFEVEISEIHVSLCQYVHSENIFPFAQADFEKLRSQIPMVPLTPGKRVCWIICCGDLQRSGYVLSVHIN